jgi:hypothetical protein
VSEKEATARIKINMLLEAAGWRFSPQGDSPANIRLEPSVTIKSADLDALGDNFEKTGKGFVDFLLLDARGFPLIVLEAQGIAGRSARRPERTAVGVAAGRPGWAVGMGFGAELGLGSGVPGSPGALRKAGFSPGSTTCPARPWLAGAEDAVSGSYPANSSSGGERAGARTGAAVGRPRCSRILRTTVPSVSSAMSRRFPPHQGQLSTSISKTRFRSSAQEALVLAWVGRSSAEAPWTNPVQAAGGS